MIVVSLKRSYPNLIDDVRDGSEKIASWRLEGITRGDWPKMSDALLDGYLDFVVGTYDDMIVTAYPIEKVSPGPNETIKFAGSDAGAGFEATLHEQWSSNASLAAGEWLVGCPMPGGPWKRGEGRGTRRYLLHDYLLDHPELSPRKDEDMGGRMALNLLEHFALGKYVDLLDYPQLAPAGAAAVPAGPDTGVTVVRQPGGTVVITIPTGVRAQLLVEPTGP